jgi:hypothetical protein
MCSGVRVVSSGCARWGVCAHGSVVSLKKREKVGCLCCQQQHQNIRYGTRQSSCWCGQLAPGYASRWVYCVLSAVTAERIRVCHAHGGVVSPKMRQQVGACVVRRAAGGVVSSAALQERLQPQDTRAGGRLLFRVENLRQQLQLNMMVCRAHMVVLSAPR